MKKIFLCEHGPEVSSLIYSFWRTDQEEDGVSYKRILNKLNSCLELGINTFDHADIYGHYQVESLFGKAVKEIGIRREDLVISTKCGLNTVDASRPNYRIKHFDSSPEHIVKSVDQSLHNFQTDYIDILLLHYFDPIMDVDETAAILTSLVRKGKIKHIGLANFTVHQHKLLQSHLDIPIITNHVELNLLNMGAITDGTIDFIKQQYSRPLAWAPLAGGRLLDKSDESTSNIRNSLKRIAANYGTNEEQLAIAWLLQLGALPILGNNSLSKIKNAAEAVTLNLDRQDWNDIYISALNN